MTLQRMGLETHCAAGTGEAFALLQKNSYDLCLTDMRLPDGDGLAVLDYVSRNHPNVPVAVITAMAVPRTPWPRSRPGLSITLPNRFRSISCARWCARL